MPSQSTTTFHVVFDDRTEDPTRVDHLTDDLRRWLLDLDVEDVRRAPGGEAPEGTRGGVGTELGSLLVVVGVASRVLPDVLSTIREWLVRRRSGTVTINQGDDSLQLTGLSSEQQDRLIESWISRHAAPSI